MLASGEVSTSVLTSHEVSTSVLASGEVPTSVLTSHEVSTFVLASGKRSTSVLASGEVSTSSKVQQSVAICCGSSSCWTTKAVIININIFYINILFVLCPKLRAC